ncbi:MAG: hypothetical protein AAFY17_04560 [Cyanobacteria bacterium J06642_11]
MLVVLLDDQVLPSTFICAGCLMANHAGEPRLSDGRLGCAQRVESSSELLQYRCQMGFRLANIETVKPYEH